MLAAYTYTSGLRAPAFIAFVKDTLIYLVIVIVAIIYLPTQARAAGHIFDAAQTKLATPNPATGKPAGSTLLAKRAIRCLRHAGARLGDGAVHVPALDHRRAVDEEPQHGAAQPGRLTAYSLMLGLLALLGFMAIAAGTSLGSTASRTRSSSAAAVRRQFPSWFAGVAFAAIAIGALVPAAIMSIAAANLFTRNIYRDFFKPDATPGRSAGLASWSRCW